MMDIRFTVGVEGVRPAYAAFQYIRRCGSVINKVITAVVAIEQGLGVPMQTTSAVTDRGTIEQRPRRRKPRYD
jgi:hypothetical protein